MAKCLRCGAGNEWIEGDARPPKMRDDGMPSSAPERALRRLLAVRVGMPGLYLDDGEASGAEHGISIDFMREPVADINAKLRALNVARAECSKPAFNPAAACSPTLTQCPRCNNPHGACDGGKTPNVAGKAQPR